MADRSFLDWPFLDDKHRQIAAALDDWCLANLPADRLVWQNIYQYTVIPV